MCHPNDMQAYPLALTTRTTSRQPVSHDPTLRRSSAVLPKTPVGLPCPGAQIAMMLRDEPDEMTSLDVAVPWTFLRKGKPRRFPPYEEGIRGSTEET